MLVAWLACTKDLPSTPVDAGADSGETAPAGTPWIGDALRDRCPDPTPRRRVMPIGATLHKVTLTGGSVCNDGSPPVIYVRAATDPAHAADWVLHLESGGLCSDAETCAARWCGEDAYDAGNMSSRWSPETAAGQGIAAAGEGNAFAGWNQVELHYCSSDFWTGQAGEIEVDGYRIAFDGHRILGDALDALLAGVSSDDGAETLPPLLPAKTVLFGGSSAGGYGTMTELGRVIDALPGVRLIATPDAAFSPAPEVLPPALAEAVEVELERQWTTYIAPLWDGYLDPSCLAAADAPWQCVDVDRLVRGPGARSGELVFHHDLYDPVLAGFFVPIGFGPESFPAAGGLTLRLYGALEGISVHGTACVDHTALDSDESFFRETVVDSVAGGPAWSLHDVLAAVVDGTEVTAVDGPAGQGSDCP